MEITLKGLNRDYGELHAVRNVSLTIPENKIYGIIGRSGAGKSTLVRLISMLEKPDSGEVWYDDRRVDDLDKKGLIEERRKIGMIFQNFNLFSSRNARENIAYPMEICGMERDRIAKRCDELLELVGLGGRGDAPISTLSGGQKQRIAIARALATNPSILFCDEATSALDPQTTRSILALLKDLQKKMNLTVVMITHQMEVVRDSCDYVAVIEKGEIVEQGLVSDIFAAPKHPVTRDFLSSVTNVRESIVRWSDKGHWCLRFRGGMTDSPILAEVQAEAGCYFNIRAAGVQDVNGVEMGIMICDIGPDRAAAERACTFLRVKDVIVEEVEADNV